MVVFLLAPLQVAAIAAVSSVGLALGALALLQVMQQESIPFGYESEQYTRDERGPKRIATEMDADSAVSDLESRLKDLYNELASIRGSLDSQLKEIETLKDELKNLKRMIGTQTNDTSTVQNQSAVTLLRKKVM